MLVLFFVLYLVPGGLSRSTALLVYQGDHVAHASGVSSSHPSCKFVLYHVCAHSMSHAACLMRPWLGTCCASVLRAVSIFSANRRVTCDPEASFSHHYFLLCAIYVFGLKAVGAYVFYMCVL